MTISAQEQQVRLQFLEEAQDYVDQIEAGLLGVGSGEVKGKQLDAVLRAAHSIKGGAAMMGFSMLSKIGHRLEDSLKVLRHGQKPEAVNGQLEKDLLLVVDRLRRVMEYNQKGETIPADWLDTAVEPILDRLYEQLGDPQAADEASLLAEEEGEDDIVVYLFESEVDSALEHLENILNDPAQPDLHSEIEITTETLNGLAEMIELPAMALLCTDIAQKLAQYPDQFAAIAALAVAAWRRSQSLVMIGHRDNLPTSITFGDGASVVATAPVATVVTPVEEIFTLNSFLDEPETAAAPELADGLLTSLESFSLPAELPVAADLEQPAVAIDLDDALLFDATATIPFTGEFNITDFVVAESLADLTPAAIDSPVTTDEVLSLDDLFAFDDTDQSLPAVEAVAAEPLFSATDELISLDELMTFGEPETAVISLDLDLADFAPAVAADEAIVAEIEPAIAPLEFSLAAEAIDSTAAVVGEDQFAVLDIFDNIIAAPVSFDFTPTAPEPAVDKLFTTDEILDPDLQDFSISDPELASELAASGSLPAAISLDELSNFATPEELTSADESAEMRTALTEQPVMDWVNNEAPPNDDFFSLLSSIEVPEALPSQPDFFTALGDLGLDDVAAVPHGQVTPETYNNIPTAPDQTIRVGVNQLAVIGDLFGELNISRSGLNLQITGMRSLLRSLTEKVSSLEMASSQLRNAYDKIASQVPSSTASGDELTAQNALTSDFDLLEMDRYGEFHLLSQAVIETVVQIQEKVTDIDIQLNETEIVTRDISRTSQQMQNSFTSVRMLPFMEVVGRFPRAIRDMAIEHGKEVDLTIKGGEILIERNVIEVLKDPLMHLLRNCFDHGIEAPADRLAAGKSATGKIEIIATYRGNQTVITIRDDGKGMDLAKIRAKAIKMGIDEDILKATGEKELLELIFEPGFSTAEKVTDLSGRGVGMDVVRTNLQEAKGEVQIETKAGQGSTFTITVPFTLSVIKALIVDVNKMLFAIPVNTVEETLLPNPEQIVTRDGQTFIDWEEFQVRLIDMAEHFKAPEFLPALDLDITPKIDQAAVFLAADGEQLYGLQVDRFWNEQEVTVRQPQGVIPLPPGLSGSAILGDGRVIPLVDPLALARWVMDQNNDEIHTLDQDDDFAETTLEREQLVMVVDDSINVRRFVALTLERNGYRVEQAKDGQEAIEKIQAGLLPNLVICDLEMPRMDGYGFLANVKSLENAKHIPVVMLTSRSGDKHRKIAMNLGAAAYYAKPFNEADMLNTISELIV
jgi:chemotaxis protein histidine kinase CheA/CheY-like chemotaxis protein